MRSKYVSMLLYQWLQEHDELEEEAAAAGPPQVEKEKAGLLSRALRAPLGTRTLSLHNLLDQAPLIDGQQVCNPVHLPSACPSLIHICMALVCNV